MAFLPILSGGLGLIGGMIGQNAAHHENEQLQQFLNQIAGQQSGVQNSLLSAISGLQGNANNYLSILPALTGDMSGLASGAGKMAGGAASTYMQNASDPNSLYRQTGVNTGALAGNATNYLSNPNGTNLAGVSPSALSFFANQMQNGLDPHVAQNAQNQLGQQFQSSLNTMRSQLAPGQNPAAMQQAAQNNLLTQSTNLAGNLAGQDQALRGQGAEGMLNTAGGLDAQKMNMLMQAFGIGNQYNQTVLGNEQGAAGFGQSVLDQLANFANTGNQMNEFATSSLGSLNQGLMQEGEYYGSLAQGAAGAAAQNNPFSILSNALAGMKFGGGRPGGSGWLPQPINFGPGGGINLSPPSTLPTALPFAMAS